MTDANKASWYRDGKKSDLIMEDLLAVCVADEEAGAADDDTLDAAPRDDFSRTIFTRLRKERGSFQKTMSVQWPCSTG